MAQSFGEYSWFGKTLILVALGFIVLVFFIIFLAKCTSDDKSKSQTEVSRKVKLTKEMITGLTLAITLKGYYCPLVKLAYSRGEDAYGKASKVWCGPADAEGTFEDAVFRVTITPQFSQSKSYEDVKVEPWTDEMSDW